MSTPQLIIAHRGASGYLPEHTLEGKALAYAQGADYLEQDIVATRDGALVVLHDLFLEQVSNVAAVYPGRQRDDGHYYVIDFTLAELRELGLNERRQPGRQEALYPERFPLDGGGRFRIATLAEEIELIRGLNRSTGRSVGLYPEIKEPRWHAAHGIDLGRHLLETLADFGYRRAGDPVFVQCFDAEELTRLRGMAGMQLKLVQLFDELQLRDVLRREREGLAAVAARADAVGLPYRALLEPPAGLPDGRPRASSVLERIRAAGVRLHPYTFRRETLPPYVPALESLLEFFLAELRVDGLFCDFPDIAVAVRDRVAAGSRGG